MDSENFSSSLSENEKPRGRRTRPRNSDSLLSQIGTNSRTKEGSPKKIKRGYREGTTSRFDFGTEKEYSVNYRDSLRQLKSELGTRQRDLLSLQKELAETKHKAASKEERLRSDVSKRQHQCQSQKDKLDNLKLKLAECKIEHRKRHEKYRQDISDCQAKQRQSETGIETLQIQNSQLKSKLNEIQSENSELSKINVRQSKDRLHEMVSNLSDQLELTGLKLTERDGKISRLESENLDIKQQMSLMKERNSDYELRCTKLEGRCKSLKRDLSSSSQYVDNMKTQIHVQMEQKKMIESHNSQLQEQIKVLLHNPQLQQMHGQMQQLGSQYAKLQSEFSLLHAHDAKLAEEKAILLDEHDHVRDQMALYLQEEQNQGSMLSQLEEQKQLIQNLEAQLEQRPPKAALEKETQTPSFRVPLKQLNLLDFNNLKTLYEDFEIISHFVNSKLHGEDLDEQYFLVQPTCHRDEDHLVSLHAQHVDDMQRCLEILQRNVRKLREDLTEKIACDYGVGDACYVQ